MPRHIVPEASRASRTAAEAGTPSLFDLSIPHRSTLMQDGLGACANTSFTPPPRPLPTLEKNRRTPCSISYASRTTRHAPTRELTYQGGIIP